MKTFLKIMMVIIGCTVIIIAGGIFYITKDIKNTNSVKIESLSGTSFKDGTHVGEYENGRFSNQISLVVANGKIEEIKVLKFVLIEKAEVTKSIIEAVIERQNTDIDIVSGATVTSKAYLKSIENALND